MTEDKLYDPLEYANLTRNLVRELMVREPQTLPLEHQFKGPGVYALFYTGNFKGYAPIRSPDSSHPIYVGKAVEAGARKGSKTPGTAYPLYNRIKEHSDSIKVAENLRIEDFRVRFMTVVPLWIVMAERFLIEHYQPVWNVCIEGFGLHDPGKGRHAGEIPWWDALHPGRAWATRLRQTKTNDAVLKKLEVFLKSHARKGD